MTHVHATARVNLECILLGEKRITGGHMSRDVIYTTRPEQASLQGQKADERSPGAGEGQGATAHGYEASSGGDGSVLELGSSEARTTQ